MLADDAMKDGREPATGPSLHLADGLDPRKGDALRCFLPKLLASPAGGSVARVLVFGSAAKGQTTPASDIDVLVIAEGGTLLRCVPAGRQAGEPQDGRSAIKRSRACWHSCTKPCTSVATRMASSKVTVA